jgi:hypothetical protein
MPLSGELSLAVSQASSTAKRRVQGDQHYDPEAKWYYTPNNCTRLFYGSKFNEDGYNLLSSYIIYRNGEGVQDPTNTTRTPCSEGVAAWTTCCTHSKYVI